MPAPPTWPGRPTASRRSKREGDDTEAINRLFAPEFRNRLDAMISFGHLPKEVVQKVVDKFVLQLEAQLADRNVTIELSDEARDWLVEHGYDEAMGARPMARLIQSTIKTPLADEVLFGGSRSAARCASSCKKDEIGYRGLGFEYPEGPVKPKPEKDVTNAAKKKPEADKAASFEDAEAGRSRRDRDGRWRRPHRAEGAAGQGMTSEVDERPLDPTGAGPRRPRLRRKAVVAREALAAPPPAVAFEEILGWILVPVILRRLYWLRRWSASTPPAPRRGGHPGDQDARQRRRSAALILQ